MIADPLRDVNKMMDDLIKKAETPISRLVVPKPDGRPLICELPALAAAEVEIEFDEIDIRDHAGRDVGSKTVPEPSQSTVSIDATDALQAEMEEWGDGSFVQSHPCGDVRVCVDDPQLFVVDSLGNRVEGGRIMCEFSSIEIDTP